MQRHEIAKEDKDTVIVEIDNKLYVEALQLAEKNGTTIEQMVNRFLCWTLEQEPECLRRWLSLSEDVAGCMDAVECYLKKGVPRPMAEYFASGRKKIIAVTANDDFTLRITFDNGEIRTLDMKPYLCPGSVFEPFMQLENFKRVYLDEQHSICWDIDPNVDSNERWDNKIDICPDCCYVDSVPCSWQSDDGME